MNRLLLSMGCVVRALPAGRVSAADEEWRGQMVMVAAGSRRLALVGHRLGEEGPEASGTR